MVTDSNKPRASTAPPHELNVRKFAESRASELESLHNIVSSLLDNDFRSQRNKRKRTTGHDDRVAKKKRFSKGRRGENGSSVVKDDKKIPRRVRRSIEFTKNLPSGFGTSGDGTKRLRTHVWYAKRFTMTKLWGFHIPLGLHGRERGSRAMLKKLKNGVLVHDASYHSAIQLEGPQEKLLLILNSVLVPSPATPGEAISCDILTGGVAGSAMLHQDGNPSFLPIAPVTYMWRPPQQITSDEEGFNNFACEQKHIDDRTNSFQVWVWIHAAAFRESHETLKSACERQMDLAGDSVQCISLEGQLGKLELVGSKVSELLQKTLFPVHCSWLLKEDPHNDQDDHAEPESKEIPKCCNKILPWHLKKCSANAHDDHRKAESTNMFKKSSLVNLTVMDPRTLNKKDSIAVSERNQLGVLSSGQMETKEQTKMSSSGKHGSECRINYSDLWEASKGLYPPVEESVVCMEKHHQRKDFIRLGSKASGTQNPSVNEKSSRSCPILLLENGRHEDSVARCSIILPLSWVKVFWLSFISNGAHAIGLREKQWISSEIGLPYFPSDFPDCNAYTNMMAVEKIVSDQKRNLLPSSKRPMEVPIPPPWNCILLNFEKQSNEAVNSHNHVDQRPVDDDPFEGFIARTSTSLNDFINKVGMKNLLLFPRVQNQKNCVCTLMKDTDFLQRDTIMPERRERCFVRVILHAYKEGVFEGGAVVCAPRIDDIMLWTRSENIDEKLNIPESSMRSYFMKSVSGKWELEVPNEDITSQESYRWPIGFVTTGFVRGSKKANAIAFCEATLLSRLRMEQWKVFNVRQRKKELYVLVRNLRSTAYRRALATIVVEQVGEDVKFI